jgi:hypothetical protein
LDEREGLARHLELVRLSRAPEGLRLVKLGQLG